jgi:hypothetical protein
MSGIDPLIIVHEIKTYPGVKPVRQKLLPVHPKKTATIKAEVEKLLEIWFYLSHTSDRMGFQHRSGRQETRDNSRLCRL